MKALLLKGACNAEIMNLPVPEIDDNQVLVRNKYCAVCNSTDTKMFKGTHALIRYPCIIGHEGAGTVESVGKNVAKLKVGDKVLAAGYPQSAEIASLWGQYSEFGVTKEEEVVLIPDNVGLEEASCCHMLTEALNAIKVGDIRPGDNIVIIGAGAVGISLLTMLKHSFPNVIIVLDIIDEKLRKAHNLGADVTINSNDPDLLEKIKSATKGKGVNKLFEAVGSPNTYNLAFDILNYHGKLIAFGLMEKELGIPFRKLYVKELQMVWCHSGGMDVKENKEIVLNMMNKGLVDVAPLITSRFKMEDFSQSLDKIAGGMETRVIIQI